MSDSAGGNSEPPFLAIGRVVSTHGLRGGVRVQLLTDFPRQLRRHKVFYLGEDMRVATLASLNVVGDHALMRFEEFTNPEAAAALRGSYLHIRVGDAARPGRGEFFWHQIIGLRVVTVGGKEIGTVAEILRTGANDVYVVKRDGRDALIPAIADVVREVDLPAGQIVIDPLPGLLPD